MGILNNFGKLFVKNEDTGKVTKLENLEEILEPAIIEDDTQTIKKPFEPANVEIQMSTDIDFIEQAKRILGIECTKACYGRKPYRKSECKRCFSADSCVRRKIEHNFNGD